MLLCILDRPSNRRGTAALSPRLAATHYTDSSRIYLLQCSLLGYYQGYDKSV